VGGRDGIGSNAFLVGDDMFDEVGVEEFEDEAEVVAKEEGIEHAHNMCSI
jgi:hypothetical protein